MRAIIFVMFFIFVFIGFPFAIFPFAILVPLLKVKIEMVAGCLALRFHAKEQNECKMPPGGLTLRRFE
jgi:hypothetical protein